MVLLVIIPLSSSCLHNTILGPEGGAHEDDDDSLPRLPQSPL
jgi:hypothetical protein